MVSAGQQSRLFFLQSKIGKGLTASSVNDLTLARSRVKITPRAKVKAKKTDLGPFLQVEVKS